MMEPATRDLPRRLVHALVLAVLSVMAMVAMFGCSTFHDYTAHGIPNFAIVDGYVARGGQPSDAGCAWLVAHGYTKWIKFTYEREGSSAACERAGLKVVHFEMPPSDARDFVARPSQAAVQGAVYALLECRTNHDKCFEGCLHGRDRTGLITALYRWLSGELERAAAWAEAKAHGFRVFFHELSDVWEDWPHEDGE